MDAGAFLHRTQTERTVLSVIVSPAVARHQYTGLSIGSYHVYTAWKTSGLISLPPLTILLSFPHPVQIIQYFFVYDPAESTNQNNKMSRP